jgi:hypothetical protein
MEYGACAAVGPGEGRRSACDIPFLLRGVNLLGIGNDKPYDNRRGRGEAVTRDGQAAMMPTLSDLPRLGADNSP